MPRLDGLAPPIAPAGNDEALFRKDPPDLPYVVFGEITALQELFQDAYPETIQARDRSGELIFVAASLDDELFADEVYLVVTGEMEPERIVFAGGKRFVETSGFQKGSAPDHDG